LNWKSDKKWSDRFIPEIKTILGQYLIPELISEASLKEDQEHNTDLTVLTLMPCRIACRIRRPQFYLDEEYRNEFTIRSGRPSGVKTDLQKMIEGWGDYLFYGFSDEAEEKLVSYLLGDLKVFRLWFNRTICENKGRVPGIAKTNKDGSSDFRAFNKAEMPEDFFIIIV